MKPHTTLTDLVDLTSLTGNEDCKTIETLCQLALTTKTAAVCIYPEFITIAKHELADSTIKVATVVNFPDGNDDITITLSAIKQALIDGADEIDVVLPYSQLLKGRTEFVLDYLKQCRSACSSACLKVIIESGELKTPALIKTASELVIKAQADFIKTSTGKTAQGASLDAAEVILNTISQQQAEIGIKISGGVRTKAQAQAYIELVKTIMGDAWLTPTHFRFGASRIFSD